MIMDDAMKAQVALAQIELNQCHLTRPASDRLSAPTEQELRDLGAFVYMILQNERSRTSRLDTEITVCARFTAFKASEPA